MAIAQFRYRPRIGAAMLASMGLAPDGGVNIVSDDFAQAAMTLMVQAELLAAQHGLVPSVPMPDGSPGVMVQTVGAAREKLDKAPPDIANAYLAAHAAVRQVHLSAGKAADGQGFPLRPGGSLEPVLAQIVVGLIVLGVLGFCAFIAHEYGTFATETAKAQIIVNGENARNMFNMQVVLAHAAAGLPLDEQHAAVLGKIAEGERKAGNSDGGFPWLPVLGGAAIVGGGYLAIRAARKHLRGRR